MATHRIVILGAIVLYAIMAGVGFCLRVLELRETRRLASRGEFFFQDLNRTVAWEDLLFAVLWPLLWTGGIISGIVRAVSRWAMRTQRAEPWWLDGEGGEGQAEKPYHPRPSHPVIIKGNEVVRWFDNGSWVDGNGDYRPTLGAGTFTLILYGIEDVGGGYLGLASVEFRSMHLSAKTHLPKTGREDLVVLAGKDVELSSEQQEAFVSHIRSEYHYWWDHATVEVRERLGRHTEEPAKRALRCVREAAAMIRDRAQLAAAVALLEEAIALDPTVRDARFTLGKIAIEEGNVDEAIRFFQGELDASREPDRLGAHSYLAAIYREQGRASEAERHASLAMETVAYKRAPSSLSSTVVAKIRRAVQSK